MAERRGKAAFFTDDEFNLMEQNTQQVQEAQEDNTTSTRSTITFGATQGKKGHKAPRINMAFSPENHEWIKTKSRQLGISATELVNTIIERQRLDG